MARTLRPYLETSLVWMSRSCIARSAQLKGHRLTPDPLQGMVGMPAPCARIVDPILSPSAAIAAAGGPRNALPGSTAPGGAEGSLKHGPTPARQRRRVTSRQPTRGMKEEAVQNARCLSLCACVRHTGTPFLQQQRFPGWREPVVEAHHHERRVPLGPMMKPEETLSQSDTAIVALTSTMRLTLA